MVYNVVFIYNFILKIYKYYILCYFEFYGFFILFGNKINNKNFDRKD